MKNICWILFVIIILTFLAYLPIFRGFFQHDEWIAFGQYLPAGKNLLSFFRPAVAHYVPLQQLLFYLYVSVFKLNFFWYALFSVLAHLIVVCLSFIFFSSLLKNRILISIIASLFFALAASGHQATSWIAADINTHGSVIFGLLALIVLYNFNKIWLSIIFLITSLLFKEATVAFFIILPLMIYIFDKRRFLKNWVSYLKIPLVGFSYLLFRFSMFFFQRANVEDQIVTETQSLFDIIVNIVTFPAKIFSQSIIPSGQLLSLAKSITKILPTGISGLYGTTAFDVYTEQVTLQILNWTIFLVGLLVLIYFGRKAKNGIVKKTAAFGFIFAVLNSYIYVLSPGRSGNISVIDSRNIYLPSLGAFLFLVSIIFILSKNKIIKTLLILLPLLFLNIFWLEKELAFMANRGTERKQILYQIKSLYPTLPEKTVFYMVSDTSFYGLPESEKMFPFETNFGYTLMVWYLPTEHFSRVLVNQPGFLYQLTDEGYKEDEERGFGYFRNFDLMIKAVQENKLQEESIIAYRYDSSSKNLIDITGQVREEIGMVSE